MQIEDDKGQLLKQNKSNNACEQVVREIYMGPVATEADLGRNDSLIAENQAFNSSTNF